MSLESFQTPDAILHLPSQSQEDSSGTKKHSIPTLVFFLTGNPGLISYYDEFLRLIAEPYDQPHSSGNNKSGGLRQVIIAGFSLGGFTTSDSPSVETATVTVSEETLKLQDELSFPPSFPRKDIYTLKDQIELCYARLENLVRRIREHYYPVDISGSGDEAEADANHDGDEKRRAVNVMLAGHSVGAYIALEMIRIHHVRSQTPNVEGPMFTITSSLLLTPTILNISHSPSGQIATPILSYLPFFPTLLQLLSTSLTRLVSQSRLTWLVSNVTGMKMGSRGLEATVRFLRSRGSVRQALSMARDEMREIGEDRWGEEVWGVVKQEREEGDLSVAKGEGWWKAPKLFFLFAKRDHWVADLTRDEIVKKMGEMKGDGKEVGELGEHTVVLDEEDGLVHAWCLEQSDIVARRVRKWIGIC